jgi:hypothetical protein
MPRAKTHYSSVMSEKFVKPIGRHLEAPKSQNVPSCYPAATHPAQLRGSNSLTGNDRLISRWLPKTKKTKVTAEIKRAFSQAPSRNKHSSYVVARAGSQAHAYGSRCAHVIMWVPQAYLGPRVHFTSSFFYPQSLRRQFSPPKSASVSRPEQSLL